MSVEVDDVELYESILEYLRVQELNLPTLTYRSPHLTNGDRNMIIEWMYHVGVDLRISNSAQHLATALFDYFIDCHQSDKQGLYLIGLSCVSIACKVEDIEINIPQSSKLINLIPLDQKPSIGSIKSTELIVLQHFDWMIHLPTEASFIDYYSASCLAMELESIDDAHYKATLTRYYNKWISYFREKTLLMDNMRSYRPSLVACAIVTSSRIALVMQPEWPKGMIHLTGIQRNEFDVVLHMLLSCLEEDLTVEHEHETQKVVPPKYQSNSLISPNQGDVTNTIAYQLSSLNFQSPTYQTVETSSVPINPNIIDASRMANLHHIHQHSGFAPVSMSGDQSWTQNFNPMVPQTSRGQNPMRDSRMNNISLHRDCFPQYQNSQATQFGSNQRHTVTIPQTQLQSHPHPHPNMYEDSHAARMFNPSHPSTAAHNVGFHHDTMAASIVSNHMRPPAFVHYNQSASQSHFINHPGHNNHFPANHVPLNHHLSQPTIASTNHQLPRRIPQNVPEIKIRKSRLQDKSQYL